MILIIVMLVGSICMVYSWTLEEDELTLGHCLLLIFIGTIIGHLCLIVTLLHKHPVVLWRRKK